jgi:hypothetical protein
MIRRAVPGCFGDPNGSSVGLLAAFRPLEVSSGALIGAIERGRTIPLAEI